MNHHIYRRFLALICIGCLVLAQSTAHADEDITARDGHLPGEHLMEVEGILLASKTYPLGETYEPLPGIYDQLHLLPVAQAAFDEMARAAASEAGLQLFVLSGYRNFAMQRDLFNRYAATSGAQAAENFSAHGGHSEHQTGLAADIGDRRYPGITLQPSFGQTEAGRWLQAQSWRFGWIVRYPKGKEKITGYQYEPWHLRYVGKETAAAFANQPDLTLEEYLGLVKNKTAALAEPEVSTLSINGQPRPIAGYLIRDMHYYPLRSFLTLLDDTKCATNVAYDGETQRIILTPRQQGPFILGDPPAPKTAKRRAVTQQALFYQNNRPIMMRAWAIDDLSYVNLRDMGNALGFSVQWHAEDKSIHISTEAPKDPLAYVQVVTQPAQTYPNTEKEKVSNHD